MENGPENTVTGDPLKDRLSGLHVYARCTEVFTKGFDESMPAAYGQLLKDWMEFGPLFISGGLISMKEHMDKLQDLQDHVRKGGSGGRSVADEFSSWLNA